MLSTDNYYEENTTHYSKNMDKIVFWNGWSGRLSEEVILIANYANEEYAFQIEKTTKLKAMTQEHAWYFWAILERSMDNSAE